MVETSVDSSHNNTNSTVLKAAEIKNDAYLIKRLMSVPNTDLFQLRILWLWKPPVTDGKAVSRNIV